MSYRTEFPREMWPEFEVPADWQDQSYSNDTCPSFYVAARGACIYVDAVDPADRTAPTDPRFTVYVYDEDLGEINFDAPVGTFDDLTETLTYLATLPVRREAQ